MPLCNGADIGCVSYTDNITGRESGRTSLYPTKTVITHVERGFDFLGQNVRRYPKGKLLIKPSKKNVGTFLNGIRRIIKDAHGASAADLIDQLNPKIHGWANYHRHVVSKRTFGRVAHTIFSNLWQWARRRHPNKPSRWVKAKYFGGLRKDGRGAAGGERERREEAMR